ncbi:DUF551 domain-containing protein [Enterobacter kobei]|uniref:DUF551 domain-containing protein n=1 Tax=Enterobacter kobei TaxID=208224 RepID=UPI003BF88037
MPEISAGHPIAKAFLPHQRVTTEGKAMEWIKCSDRIPGNTEFVLCIEKRSGYGTYGKPFVCWHDGDGWVGKTNYRPTVTHWMTLPEPPTE